ncbi:methyl-accepting chemotaxis protein [Lysinibacillus sp. KU-BSD001]|uniref:methyl-accepting chemotaxis protein n=1 Tax=Lysinibacillus sp. KU-BSD001 TaxID=3141328 RepID=UPI0036E40BA7
MRILSVFIILLVFLAIFAGYNFFSNTQMENKAESLVEEDIVILNASQNLATSVSVRLSAALSYVITGDATYIDVFNEYRKLAEENNAIIEQYVNTEERNKLVETARTWSNGVENDVFAVYQSGDAEQALKNLTAINSLVTEVRTGYEQIASERAQSIETVGNDVVQTSSNNKIIGLVVSLAITVIGIVLAMLTANQISRPIQAVADRMQQLADGHLGNEPLQVGQRRDEVGTLMTAANGMNDKLKSTIQSISEVSVTVASSSEELAQSSNEVKTGAEQVVYTMQELAAGTETQASTAGDLAEAMRTFSHRIQETTQEGIELKNHSNEVQKLTESGKGLMMSSTDQMSTINEIVLESVRKVEDLNEQSAEISKLVSVIDDISNQTNLLALNAAIEAARAGEHGKGFAVVADEVRKLAEQVQFSVADISAIVSRIQQETGNVTRSLQDGYNEVKKGTEQITETNETFNDISGAVEYMIKSIDTIAANLNNVLASTEEIGTSIDEIASISEESAAGVEQTTATTEETVSTMEEVVRSADQLAALAEQLNAEVQQFKL